MPLLVHAYVVVLTQELHIRVIGKKLQILHTQKVCDVIGIDSVARRFVYDCSEDEYLHGAHSQSLSEQAKLRRCLFCGSGVDDDRISGVRIAHLLREGEHAFDNRLAHTPIYTCDSSCSFVLQRKETPLPKRGRTRFLLHGISKLPEFDSLGTPFGLHVYSRNQKQIRVIVF